MKGLKIMNSLAELMANSKGNKKKPIQKQMKADSKPSMASDSDEDDAVTPPKVSNAPTSKKPVKY